jgi:hypothetical protein
VIGVVIFGKGAGGLIVQTFVVALQLGSDDGILKLIVSALTVLFAITIASRNEPEVGVVLFQLSFVVVTTRVAARAF